MRSPPCASPGFAIYSGLSIDYAKPPFHGPLQRSVDGACEPAEPRTEIAGIEGGLLEVHRMPDAGDDDQPAIRHRLRHPLEIGRRNPAILLAPDHEVRMPDLLHPPLELAALPLYVDVERGADPDALGIPEG